MKIASAAAVALAAACLFIGSVLTSSALAHDFSWPWQAARLLMEGRTPYGAVLFPALGPAFDDPFFYPLPAALLAVPLAPLPALWAGAVFVGGSVALLWWYLPPHLRPILLSAPCIVAVRGGQWAPLLVAGLFCAPAALAWACKPTLGLALWLTRPSWRTAAIVAAFVGVSLAVRPTWPAEWLSALHGSTHHPIPLLSPAGAVLGPLMGLVVWRGGLRSERGRLAIGLCCVPQMVWFYDQLPALLVARTTRQAWALAAWSWVVYAAVSALMAREWYALGTAALFVGTYAPALYTSQMCRYAGAVVDARTMAEPPPGSTRTSVTL